jgi:hypothetical protein
MPLMKLSQEVKQKFADAPEVQMGVQLGKAGSHYYPVIGSQVAVSFYKEPRRELVPDEGLSAQIQALHQRAWINDERLRMQFRDARRLREPAMFQEARINDFLEWYRDLPEGPESLEPAEVEDSRLILGLIFHGPVGPLPPVPTRLPYVYGHLQFYGDTEPDDVFYRYEYYPASLRVFPTVAGGWIKDGTYAAPSSEAQFVATGFGAVARFALPTLWPARWRWELQPVPNSRIKMGASVPLYGQSGGGVEVMFEHKTDNRGPIANQFLLPIT